MSASHYAALLCGYATALAGWLAALRLWPAWPARARPVFAHPWREVVVTLALLAPLTDARRRAVHRAVARYGAFLGAPAVTARAGGDGARRAPVPY